MKSISFNPLNKIVWIATMAIIGITVFTIVVPKPDINITDPSGGSSAQSAEAVVVEDLFTESHTSKDHNPYIQGSLANTAWIPFVRSTFVPGGPFDPNKIRCGIIKAINAAGKLETIRASVWVQTDQWASMVVGGGTPGIAVSFFVANSIEPLRGPWSGAYPKSMESFGSFQPRSDLNWKWEEVPCDDPNFPGLPPGMNPAQ